jgi:peptidyl-prolyl isomerase G (cyclophilin G)
MKFSRKRASSEEKQKPTEEESNVDLHPLASVTQIDPEGIPKVPENKFLDRIRNEKDKENEPKNEEAEKPAVVKKKPRIRGYTRSGRAIKGRGALVSIGLLRTGRI